MNSFGTVHQILTKRWRLITQDLMTYLLSKPEPGTIFIGHPELQDTFVQEYGTVRGGLWGWERRYQTMRNTPVQKALFEEGKAYVSVGFVDLQELQTSFCKRMQTLEAKSNI